MRQVLLYRGEDGYWVAECPSLPGCVSQGKTRDAAIENIREAIRTKNSIAERYAQSSAMPGSASISFLPYSGSSGTLAGLALSYLNP